MTFLSTFIKDGDSETRHRIEEAKEERLAGGMSLGWVALAH